MAKHEDPICGNDEGKPEEESASVPVQAVDTIHHAQGQEIQQAAHDSAHELSNKVEEVNAAHDKDHTILAIEESSTTLQRNFTN